jgi:hypothetical protein
VAWQPFLPPEGHPEHGAFRRLAWSTEARHYIHQATVLEELYNLSDEVFIASLSLVDRPETGVRSSCVWADGVRALLPRSDLIGFVFPGPTNETWRIVPVLWNEALLVMADAMEPQGLCPERWLVERFPNDDELTALEEHEVRISLDQMPE